MCNYITFYEQLLNFEYNNESKVIKTKIIYYEVKHDKIVYVINYHLSLTKTSLFDGWI